jgi:hypothetical protein
MLFLSIFACLMIFTGFAAGAGILLEKWSSGYHTSEDQKIPETFTKILFSRMTKIARRRT